MAGDSSAAEYARRSNAQSPNATADEDAAAAQQVLENTRANCKRSRDEASGAHEDARSSPPRAAKRSRRLSFTDETQVRVFYPRRLEGGRGEDREEEVIQRDVAVQAKTADGPSLVGMTTSALITHAATSNSLDVSWIRHLICTQLVQCGIAPVTAMDELDILCSVYTKLEDLQREIQARGSVGILPSSMRIGTSGLVVLRQLQRALEAVASAILAPTDLSHVARARPFPEAKACLDPLLFHSTSCARPEH